MTSRVEFEKTGYFSSLINDYIAEKESLKSFYDKFPSVGNLKLQAAEKSASFSDENRMVLVEALRNQYAAIEVSPAVKEHLHLLEKSNTVTITTGHQLNLFSGPLYFVYKIFSVINLCERLKKEQSAYNYVPVYWMATEDHDFLEINYFNFKGKKIQWNYSEGLQNDNGYVGEYPLESLEEIADLFEQELGIGDNAQYLIDLFRKAYLNHQTLAAATRCFVNTLFEKYGLLILDGNDKVLKTLYVPNILNELTNDISFEHASKKANQLAENGYKIQVNPREVNLFYGIKGLRNRIEKAPDGKFIVVDTAIKWENFEAIEKEVKSHPERFSPNVLLRPLYQEVILPNIAYVGGGGELAYWLQLKEVFAAHKEHFPILILRDSVLLIDAKTEKKRKKLNIPKIKLFKKQNDLINWRVREISNIPIDFSVQKETLEKQFEDLKDIACKTDISFLGAVNAQQAKQLKGLEKLEKRLLKAQRLKLKDEVERVVMLQNQLFPQQSLQERKSNFSEFYLAYGDAFFDKLKDHLNPLDMKFKIINFD